MEVLQRTANRGSISTGEYEIANSLKFEIDNSECLTKTFGSSGNRKAWTWSSWVKRTELNSSTTYQLLFSAGTGNPPRDVFFFDDDTDDTLCFFSNGGLLSSATLGFRTNAVFRDTSAWYHIVLVLDTANSTAADRLKLYVNGVSQTFSTYNAPTQNADSLINSNTDHAIGRDSSFAALGFNAQYFSGYMAETHFVDGSQLAPTDFGEYDEDSGIWKPKAYTGSYGTNGFYLDFEDNTSAGKDTSGNNNNFSDTNLNAADHATDTPTNNGCTLNVLASLEGSNDITEGALVSTGKAGGGGNFNGTYGTIGIDPFNSSVDWYWEIETSIGTSGSLTDIGIGWIKESRITSGSTAYNNVYADGISRYSSQTANAAGDIWGVLLETGTTPVMKLYRNDGLIYTATHGSGGVSFDTLMFPYITVKGTSVDARLNFLNPASSFSIASGNADPNGYGNFEFDPKGGYALCTKNLAEFG